MMNISDINSNIPLFPSDTIIFGILAAILAAIFILLNAPFLPNSIKLFPRFYCVTFSHQYLLFGIIADKWIDVTATIAHLQERYGNLDGIVSLKQLKDYIITNQVPYSNYKSLQDLVVYTMYLQDFCYPPPLFS